MNKISVSDFAFFTPPENDLKQMPKLEFCDPLFRRRLSQISRMTIQVVHDLIQKNSDAQNYKIIFSSFRGELSRQFKINKSLIEDGEITPANFSISVFNTPVAATTIACKIKNGYSAIYPSDNDFNSSVICAASSILSGEEEKIIFVYADEFISEEYLPLLKNSKTISKENFKPLAFACLFEKADFASSENSSSKIEIDLSKKFDSPSDFLTFLQTSQK